MGATLGNGFGVLRAVHKERAKGQRIVLVGLGALLVATALLKAQGPSDGTLGQNLILFSPRVRFAAMEAEAILGLWFLSGWAKRAAWLVAVAFFLVLAGTSLYLGLLGQSSCGCFGRIPVSPWGAFGLDALCLTALAWCRPSIHGMERVGFSRWRWDAITIASGVVAILGVGLGGILLAGVHPGDFLARARGELVSVDPPVTDMGTDVAGQAHRFTVRLQNHSDRPIKIVGGTASCSCLATGDLPISIPPGESAPITVTGSFKGTTGLFQNEFYFYTDEERQHRVLARFKGRIIESVNSGREKTP